MGLIKSFFKGWNWFEIAFLITAFIIPISAGVTFKSSVLEVSASVTSLIVAIFVAKARIEGRFLIFLSVTLYMIVCVQQGLYGEVFYCLVLLLPLNVYAIFNWLKNKRNDKIKGPVAVITEVRRRELLLAALSQIIMGVGYYFILGALGTELLVLSTLSVMTAVVATFFVARRSPLGMIGWMINDLVVIAMWGIIVWGGSTSSVVMLIMLCMYLINDIYGTFSWFALKKTQDVEKHKL